MLEHLTTPTGVVRMSNTKARLILGERDELSPGSLVDLNIWEVPIPVPGSRHCYKYRLAYVVDGECVLRYDNERGKGDHRHSVNRESSYAFSSLKQLLADFRSDMEIWKRWRST
ncbi:hypothetical protein AWB79_05521 [Caballeronia hypogeia]|uniref:Uncharacterized protein n=1 Tax=Caballeronia hypogeia TaxID=1777140 RepID=A0A158CKE7_9BURK|nr:DUF6516 family protein [Caballeronia hypogeia]SAK82740.1 hypothetical protein AWB79_05521 [Caballeronia hypogeia]